MPIRALCVSTTSVLYTNRPASAKQLQLFRFTLAHWRLLVCESLLFRVTRRALIEAPAAVTHALS